MDSAKLQEMFLKFGNSKVFSEDRRGKGYGLVQFETADSAKDAIEKLNGSVVGGKPMYMVDKFIRKSGTNLPSPIAEYTNLYIKILYVSRAHLKPEPEIIKYQASNVYAKNLDGDVTEHELFELFSECGNITSAKLVLDEKEVSRGFGFVVWFSLPEKPNRAVYLCMASLHWTGIKILYVSRAHLKPEPEQILRRIIKYQASNVYAKNLDGDVTEHELSELFSECGNITSAKLVLDEESENDEDKKLKGGENVAECICKMIAAAFCSAYSDDYPSQELDFGNSTNNGGLADEILEALMASAIFTVLVIIPAAKLQLSPPSKWLEI